MSEHVFVYGTLRRGEYNHPVLQGARYLGEHVTPARYRLWHCGRYPAASHGGNTAIVGEVYAVTPRQLKALDRLEGVPRHYQRHRIDTPWGRAWIYLVRRRPPGASEIRSGDWCRRTGMSDLG